MDIDIDIAPSTNVEGVFPTAVRASVVKQGVISKHPVGVYLQNMPRDPFTKLAAIPYDVAPDRGFFKFDLLNLHILDHYKSKDKVRELANTDPNWNLLLDSEVVAQLFHISKHYEIVSTVRPRSVQELADCLALIRPGKRRLLEKYVRNPAGTRDALYAREEGQQYAYKRSHAVAYALVIVLQLHTLDSGHSLQFDDALEW